MFRSKEDHRLHQPNYYSNFQIVQHQNGIPQAPAAMPPQQQQHPTPTQQLQQHQHQHQQQQQQQQQPSTHRPAQQIPTHYATNQQMQHHQQWSARPPPILTTPPFFQQFPTTLPSSTQYCAPQAQYYHPQRVSQPTAAVAPSQQRPILHPGCAMYPTLRQNVLSQPSAAIMTPTTSSAAQQIQVQYFSPAQYCQPPIMQPTYGHVIAPAIPDAPVVKHRKHAIPIIDPNTQENILERELRKSESASPALSIAATTSSMSNDLKESDNSVENEQSKPQEDQIQEQQQDYLQLKQHHLLQQQQLEQDQEEHQQMETHPMPTEKEEIEEDNETEQVEEKDTVTECESVSDSQPTSQLDHVDSIEVDDEVESTITDEETQATDITPIATRSTTPISNISTVPTPPEGTNETKVESPKCEVDDTDATAAEINSPAAIVEEEVTEEKKAPSSNQKPATNTAQTQQNKTKSNKQSRKQQQQQPTTSSKTSSKKNKKNKRAKELQKKQQKILMQNAENNNNTIKQTTTQSEETPKQVRSSSPRKREETPSGAEENTSAVESLDRTDGFERDSESASVIESAAETISNVPDDIDQDTQSITSSKLMKYLDSNDDNELLFLNSSMSGYEDEICASPPVQDTSGNEKTSDILFGDFSQKNSAQELSAQDDEVSLDEIDDDDSLTNPKEGKRLIYTMQQLKKLADEPNSKLPPTIREEIRDIIAKNPRDGGAASSQTGHYQQNQMFQQLSYKDSMNYVNRKRNKQQYHHQQYEQSMQQQQHQRNPDIIRINLSLNEEIRLAESNNAWVPAGLQITNPKAEAENDEQMLKKIRGILNKLTPENFSKLLQNATESPITGEERIKKVMLLIFEKTVSEPNFAPTYARFCKFLFNQQNKNNLAFKANLIKRIREEFDSNVNNAKAKNAKLQPLMEKLAAATDPKEKLELKAELDDQEYQFRRRAWGTVRFIGEMCKVGFIGTDRVCTCIENLLDPQCEEKLEYMCKLLTTVGAQLEPADSKQQATSGGERAKIVERLDTIFKSISRLLAEKKKGIGPKISSRVRFMMQDVLELRSRGWDQKPAPKLPSREVSPAFIGRGQPQRAGKLGGGSNYMTPGVYEKRRQPGDSQKTSSQVNIDVNKLLPLFNKDETTIKLGNASLMMWKTVGRPQQQMQRPLSPPKMQQTERQQSGSLQSVDTSKESSPTSKLVKLTNEECKRLLNGLIEVTIEEEEKKYWFDKWKKISPEHHSKLIYYLLVEHIHSKYMNSPPQANACRRLFTSLMKENLLTQQAFTLGYRKFTTFCDDLLVDVPNCWQYVFNLLGPMLYHKLIPFDILWKPSWCKSLIGEKFVQSMVLQFTSEFGANYMRSFWESNTLHWDEFMSTSKVPDFVAKNRFEFVEDRKKAAPIFIQRSAEELVQRIKALLEQSDQDIDLIIDFISTNVNIDSDFINNLTMFLCDYTVIYCNTPDSSSISSNSSKANKFSDSDPSASATPSTAPYRLRRELFVAKCIPLLRWCTDCTDDREFACLDAIVKKCNQLCESLAEELISSILMELYVEEVISKDSLEKWKKLRTEGNKKLANELDAIFKKLQF